MNKCKLSIEKPYATLTFLKEGAFNPELLSEFNAYLDDIENNESITALIITGSDKNFCQGLDLESIGKMQADKANEFVKQCMHSVGRLLYFPIPVVSAINGHAFGLGAMISLASDYSVMRADKGFFCLPEIDIRMNLTPSMNALVTHKLKGRVLRDILLTGKRIGGAEAEQLEVIDLSSSEKQLLKNSRAIAEPMTGKDRIILSALKKGVNKGPLAVIFSE